ncbi:MAG: YebC/PmpR family DNA-binding transcriptional regulator, partial [Alphaproteobacteria bacterium]|nr:YebC/PmpR family DNA-binding transcriptional regulator [Alphaproteobacteria bacterium]
GGVAIIVDGLTDNRNRTASEVRSAFNKHNGNLGETNSVSFGFDRLGQIRYPAKVASADEMFETAIEAGAEDVNSTDDSHEIMCPKESFAKTRDFLAQKFGDPESAALSWVPQNTIKVDADTARTLLKLIDALEDNDDIQTVSANYEMSDDVLKELTS